MNIDDEDDPEILKWSSKWKYGIRDYRQGGD
jgi:hypothetical protein